MTRELHKITSVFILQISHPKLSSDVMEPANSRITADWRNKIPINHFELESKMLSQRGRGVRKFVEEVSWNFKIWGVFHFGEGCAGRQDVSLHNNRIYQRYLFLELLFWNVDCVLRLCAEYYFCGANFLRNSTLICCESHFFFYIVYAISMFINLRNDCNIYLHFFACVILRVYMHALWHIP